MNLVKTKIDAVETDAKENWDGDVSCADRRHHFNFMMNYDVQKKIGGGNNSLI